MVDVVLVVICLFAVIAWGITITCLVANYRHDQSNVFLTKGQIMRKQRRALTRLPHYNRYEPIPTSPPRRRSRNYPARQPQVYNASAARCSIYDREHHHRMVGMHENEEFEQLRVAELARKERASAERAAERKEKEYTKSGPSHRGKARWGDDTLAASERARRETEKAHSQHMSRVHHRQLASKESMRIAQLAEQQEMQRVGYEIGGN